MKELVMLCELCDASVHVTYNQHKAYYETVEQYLSDIDHNIPAEKVSEIIELDTIYEVQFYPHTPIGSYHLYGSSLYELIDEALQIALHEHKKMKSQP